MQADTFAKIWEETVVIPTYPAGQPDKSPLFIEKRYGEGISAPGDGDDLE